MKILVTVKQVPDTSGKVSVKPDGTLDRGSMKTIINPDDLNAVEAALTLKMSTAARWWPSPWGLLRQRACSGS